MSDRIHGTPGEYNNGGCRCPRCREAWALYMRDRRRPRVARAQAERRLRLVQRNGESARVFRQRAMETRRQLRVGSYYDGQDATVTVRLTPLAVGILDAAQARTGRGYDDLCEHLVRTAGAAIAFDESAVGRVRPLID